jgi:type I restriction enzyme, S subunit
MSKLPIGWMQVSVTDVVALHDKHRVPLNGTQRKQMKGDYAYYGANGLVDHINKYIFDGEYTLLAEDGGHFDDPKRGVAYEAVGQFWVNNHAHILEALGGIPNRFLRYALNSINWMPHVGGTTRLKLTQGGLQQALICVPPLPEQRRIVAKVDSLSVNSGNARTNLDRVPRLAERYKQAVLTSAFQGKLTLTYRHNRKSHWPVVQPSNLFKWSSGKNLPSKGHANGNIPVIGGNGINGYHNAALIDFPTLVVGRVGAHCGNVHRSDGPAWITDNAIFAKSISSDVDLDFAVFFFRAADLNSLAGGTGQPYVNQTTLNDLEMRLPPIEEQREIVRLIKRASAWIDRIVSETNGARKLLDRLEQAILTKAFQGELVPQDPNDEPASALLERIKAERLSRASAKKVRRQDLLDV